MYYWRNLSAKQRFDVLEYRKIQRLPWHRPPHFSFDGSFTFIITAACFEHNHIIGANRARMATFERELLDVCLKFSLEIFAWCILTNHYHLLLKTERMKELRKNLGLLHGRTAKAWNDEDNARGRKVWFDLFERPMQSNRHYWASLNYVHNNAVHHGYVNKWQDWPYSSAHQYLEHVGADEAARVWREYPVLNYGKGWDEA
jgi:putative transposase